MDRFRLPGSDGFEYFHDICLCSRDTGDIFYKGFGFIYLELANFVKSEEESTSDLDKVFFMLKHMPIWRSFHGCSTRVFSSTVTTPSNLFIFVSMLKTDGHINSIKRIALIWFILFSLSPCALKAVLVDSVNTDFAKTLNKAQATAPINACQYVRNDRRQTALVTQAKIDKKQHLGDFLSHQHVVAVAVKTYGKYPETHTGNSPPKFILFKRWKFGVA